LRDFSLLRGNFLMRNSKTLTCAVFTSGLIAIAGGTAQAETFQTGEASWYGPGFHGRQTANGERFNTNDLTAAHKTLPFGTKVKVTNEQTGESVVVRINDRGPYAKDRVIDLSKASAQAIGISGVAKVILARL
jgi:rare lipoprotein A